MGLGFVLGGRRLILPPPAPPGHVFAADWFSCGEMDGGVHARGKARVYLFRHRQMVPITLLFVVFFFNFNLVLALQAFFL